MILIFAEDLDKAERCAIENSLQAGKWRFVGDTSALKAGRGQPRKGADGRPLPKVVEVWAVPGFWRNPNAEEITAVASARHIAFVTPPRASV